MKKILGLLPLLISSAVFSMNAVPDKCPSIAALKTVGLDRAMFTPNSHFLTWTFFNNDYKNKYDTNVEWSFGMIIIVDGIDGQSVMLRRANEAIGKMTLLEGPFQDDSDPNNWGCTYGNENEGVIGIAITPPRRFDQNASPNLLSRVRH